MAVAVFEAAAVTNDVFVRRGFWSDDECARLRLAMDQGVHSPAEVFEEDFIVKPDVRNALDVAPGDAAVAFVEKTLAAVMRDVARHFGMPLRTSEGAGFLRYGTGGLYKVHRDVIEDVAEQFPRRISVVVFLSAVQGGELRLHPDDGTAPVDLPPVPGTLIAFRSDVLHEVRPVVDGVRDVVVDWYY